MLICPKISHFFILSFLSFLFFFYFTILFLKLFAGFAVKKRIDSHPLGKEFILSQTCRCSCFPDFLKLFKGLFFFFWYPHFYLHIYFEDFVQNTIYFNVIWTVSFAFFEVTEYELISER